MSRVLRLLWLKLADLCSRPLVLVFLLALPLLLGWTAGEANQANRRTAVALAVIDEDQSDASRSLLRVLQAQGWQVRGETAEQAGRLLLQQLVDGSLRIPPGFGAGLATLNQPPLAYTPAEGSLLTGIVQDGVVAALMPAYSQRAMADQLARIHREQGRPVPEDLEPRIAVQVETALATQPLVVIDYVGSLRVEPTLTPVVSDHSLEAFFLTIYAVLGSLALASTAVQRRLSASHRGLALDFLASQASLLLLGSLQILLYSGAMLLRSGEGPAGVARLADLGALGVCLFLMLGVGQLLTLLDERVRLFLGLTLALLLAIAGGCFFPLSAAFVMRIGRHTPIGWTLSRILGVPVLPAPLMLLASAALMAIGYQVMKWRIRRPGGSARLTRQA